MTRFTSEAIVIRTDVRGESDLQVSLLTPGRGRVSAIAKGALRSMKRFAGALDLGAVIEAGLLAAPRTGRAMIEHASVKSSFPSMREGPLALARASLIIEVASLTVAELEPAPGAYAMLKRGLERTCAEPGADRWPVTYAWRLLAVAGYRPMLTSCVHCGRQDLGLKTAFCSDGGGLLCPDCCRLPSSRTGLSPDHRRPVSLDTVKTLEAVISLPEERLAVMAFTRKTLAQARSLLAPFAAWRLGRPLHSLAFIERMSN